ncbi:hypothetical protein [Maritimibacter sp. DP1N21-5]|uniref:hypothetical protein n=1 Tax=Maritimibacter sp. DP1N21-5 TaxID=2836867 RepID=UPI001C44AEB2|nr:hypothetical protein [Maritimibacter sp. DP1N21-5]MBV7408649.1 hypothetical protein [Maritimibacter sp. DP1N21-5]
MKRNALIFAVAAAMFTSTAHAQVQDVVNAAVSELTAQGYTRFEVKQGFNGIKVEATGPNGEIERVYNSLGELLREEVNGRHMGAFLGGRGWDDDDHDDDDDHGRRHGGRGWDDDDDDDDHGRHRSGRDDDHDDDRGRGRGRGRGGDRDDDDD